MIREHVTVFPDTNALLHYRPIKEIDWLKLCDAKSVKIVLCLEVIHELDEKKNHSLLSGRAQRVIKEVRAFRSSGQPVREGVVLDVFNEEFDDSTFPYMPSADDRIVHLVKLYAEKNPTEEVCILTEDHGMILRCEAHTVTFIEPEKATRLETPQSDLEKKYKQAVTDLNDLKNRQPVIQLVLGECEDDAYRDDIPNFVLSKPALEDIEAQVEAERLTLEIAGKVMRASDASLKRYARQSKEYLTKFRQELIDEQGWEDGDARRIRFWIHVINSGNSVARDVSVFLLFPPLLDYIKDENRMTGGHVQPERPLKRPDPPIIAEIRPHVKLFGEAMDRLGGISPLSLRMPDMPYISPVHGPWSDIVGNAETGFKLHLTMLKLVQHDHDTFGPFRMRFKTWDSVRPFSIETVIRSSDLPDLLPGKLTFIVELGDKADD